MWVDKKYLITQEQFKANTAAHLAELRRTALEGIEAEQRRHEKRTKLPKHQLVTLEPRTTRPRPPVPPIPTLAPGSNLPLRVLNQKALEMQYWSLGKAYPQKKKLQHKRSPEILLAEKPIETMTWQEIYETSNFELISESRRAWLTTGQRVDSLDMEFESAESALKNFIEDNDNPNDTTEFDKNAIRYRKTPFTTFDPIVLKQIDWQRRCAASSDIFTTKIVENETTGAVKLIKKSKYMTAERFAKTAKRIAGILRQAHGDDCLSSYNELMKRIENTVKETVIMPDMEFWEYQKDMKRHDWHLQHSSYESTRPAILTAEKEVFIVDDDLLEEVDMEPDYLVSYAHHRPGRFRKTDGEGDPELWLWHRTNRDPNEMIRDYFTISEPELIPSEWIILDA